MLLGWISISIASLKRKLIHAPGYLGQDASSVEHDPMTNINMTFFQANFSGYYSTHSLMMVFTSLSTTHFSKFTGDFYMLDDFRPKSLMVEQGRLNIFLGGMLTMLMLCSESTLLIWLKDCWYIRVLKWFALLR